MHDSVEQVAGRKAYTVPVTKIGPLTDEAREYLTAKRGLTLETLESYRVGCTEGGVIAIPFFDEKDVRQLVKFRSATGGMLKLGERQVKTFIEPGGRPILLGSHLADSSAGALVICFGDYDAMSVYQDGVANAVSLPFGDKGLDWIAGQWDFLETFKEIVLFPDNDEYPSSDAAARAHTKLSELVERLGKHRVRVVAKKDAHGHKDANELLLLKGSGACRTAIEGAEWFPEDGLIRVADYVDEPFEPGRPTGFRFIDEATGGFGKGHLVLIGGENGAGKTTLALKLIAEQVEQKAAVIYWSGEQRVGRIRYWFDRIAAGPDNLKEVHARTGFKLWFPKDEYLSAIRDWYREYFYQYTDFFTTAPKFFEVCELAIRRYGCRMVVIDNLMAFTGGEGDNYYQAQGDFAQSCKMFAEKWSVTVVLICHNRKRLGKAPTGIEVPGKDDVEGSKKVTNWADVLLQAYRVPEDFKDSEGWEDADGAINLCKNRETGQEGVKKTRLDKKSNRIVEASEFELIAINYSWHRQFTQRSLI